MAEVFSMFKYIIIFIVVYQHTKLYIFCMSYISMFIYVSIKFNDYYQLFYLFGYTFYISCIWFKISIYKFLGRFLCNIFLALYLFQYIAAINFKCTTVLFAGYFNIHKDKAYHHPLLFIELLLFNHLFHPTSAIKCYGYLQTCLCKQQHFQKAQNQELLSLVITFQFFFFQFTSSSTSTPLKLVLYQDLKFNYSTTFPFSFNPLISLVLQRNCYGPSMPMFQFCCLVFLCSLAFGKF